MYTVSLLISDRGMLSEQGGYLNYQDTNEWKKITFLWSGSKNRGLNSGP